MVQSYTILGPLSSIIPLHGPRSLEDYSPWGHKESDMQTWLSDFHFHRCPRADPQGLYIHYIMWHEGVIVTDGIKVANQLMLK